MLKDSALTSLLSTIIINTYLNHKSSLLKFKVLFFNYDAIKMIRKKYSFLINTNL